MKVAVITISDRASAGIYEDLSGKKIEEMLKDNLTSVAVQRLLVPDEKPAILKALQNCSGFDFILTTGGTGIGPRDVTPETTEAFCDKDLPGIAELLRAESYKETPNAVLSRGYSGLKGNTIVVNFPGSVKAVTLCTRLLLPIMEHTLKMLKGEGH